MAPMYGSAPWNRVRSG